MAFLAGLCFLYNDSAYSYVMKMWEEIQFIIVWDLSKEVFVILATVYFIDKIVRRDLKEASGNKKCHGKKTKPDKPKPDTPPPPINPR